MEAAFVSLRDVETGLDELAGARSFSRTGVLWRVWIDPAGATVEPRTNEAAEAELLKIARDLLLRSHAATFDRHGRDSLDFHECYIESIRAALVRAYEYGLTEGKRSR